jgi:hypothetical protein
MIGRRSTKRLAELYLHKFARATSSSGSGKWVLWDEVYDFLYERDFDAHFCNAAKSAAHNGARNFEEFILRLHTGESVAKLRVGLSVALGVEGQGYLRNLAEAILIDVEAIEDRVLREGGAAAKLRKALKAQSPAEPLRRALELDGYVFKDNKLLHVESNIIDVEKQHSALIQLARDLELAKLDVIQHHLDLSEEHYAAGRWDDCIGNARKFLECCMQESAAGWSSRVLNATLPDKVYERAAAIRDFLLKQKLLTDDEYDTLGKTYGLLSGTGNHPFIAANDQARMLRQVALIYSEFVMLRVQGALNKHLNGGGGSR